MPREIKFRAWDKKEKNFVYFDALTGLLSECDETYRQLNIGIFEQYTGLKDKNGKEWFAGDKSEAEEGVYGVVVFEEGSFCFAWYEMTERHGVEYIETTKMTDYHYDGMEIIGNIHEESDK
jgi:uncharacterized phage protein (TIGR01671 family)